MVDNTIWKLDLQAGNSQATLKAFENSLNIAKDKINQVVGAGQNFEKLSSFQTKAAEAGKRLEVAQASAALALKKAEDAANGGKASAEQVALAQARAGLAAEKVHVAENALAGAIQKASTEMQGGTSHATTLRERLASLENTIKNTSGGFLDFASKIGNATTGIKNIVGWAMSAGQALLEPISSAESLGISFTTLMGGSKKAASELIQTLNHFADITPFEPEPVQQYAAQLIGMGIDAKQTIPIMTSLGDALFGIGHGTEAEMKSVVDQIGKIRVAGVMTWGDISQLQTHGIDALGAMSLATGKTKESLRDLAGSGGIPAKLAIDALTKGIEMNPLYQGGMAKQAASLSGILSTLSGYLKTGLNSFLGLKDGMIQTGSVLDRVKGGIQSIATVVSGPAFQQFAEGAGKAMGEAFDTIGTLISANVVPALVKIAPVIQDIGNWFVLSFQRAQPLIEQAGGVLGQFFNSIVNFIASDQFSNLIADFESLANQILRADFSGLQSIGSVLNPVLSTLGSILTGTVVPILDTFVLNLGKLYGWFNDNSIAAQAVKDVLIGIGVAIATIQIGAFLATLPALIGGFIAWGVAAWGAAAGVIAATWPLLLIGAAIALVVAGIILAVQHWGDITKFLQGVWSAFSAWFMGALAAIGAFFVGVWNGIVAGLKVAWDFIVNVIKIGALLALAVLFAPIVAMAALFIWLYNHNYYFKALVDGIVSFFQGCFAWCVNEWHGFVGWLGVLWAGIAVTATAVWNYISGAIKTAFSASIGFVAWVWGVISSFFANAWSTYIARPLTALWQNVSNVFSSAWGTYIAGPIGSLWTSISTTVGGWATKAVDWGKNLIQSFIDGIKAKAVAVGTALADTAKKIANFLGFHSPTKEGPGSEADQWAPNFIKMYTSGLEAGIPQIQAAMNKLAMPISANLSVSATSASSQGTSQSGNNDQVVGLLAAILDALQKQGRGGGITMNANVAAGSVDAQRINQIVQSLGGKAAEMMQRGGG